MRFKLSITIGYSLVHFLYLHELALMPSIPMREQMYSQQPFCFGEVWRICQNTLTTLLNIAARIKNSFIHILIWFFFFCFFLLIT